MATPQKHKDPAKGRYVFIINLSGAFGADTIQAVKFATVGAFAVILNVPSAKNAKRKDSSAQGTVLN